MQMPMASEGKLGRSCAHTCTEVPAAALVAAARHRRGQPPTKEIAMTTSFITTAIPYVNARPHLGFAYELVLADILARHRRRRGRDTRFATGTDDNSLKNVAAARREG